MTLPHLTHPKWRPDIDGLRAVAILAVVVYHGFPSKLQGGFIGVDVFFVISGFLISSIIFRNLDQGTFSFAEFYSRRVRRIFPALVVVLAASFVLGWFVLLPDEYAQLGKHIAGGAGFIANFVLWHEAGYFDNAAETKPLLHLWSLGVEEQFYIVWPLLVWFAWKRRFNLFAITLAVAIISFALSLMGVKTDPVAAFYSPQTRFWELMAGSLLAWTTLYGQPAMAGVKTRLGAWMGRDIWRDDGQTLANVVSVLGLLLIVVGCMRIHSGLAFPGAWAMVPVAGAVLLIAAGPRAWLNRTLLSHKLALWVGWISYPLYLWHWPLLSLAYIVEGGMPDRGIRIAAVVLAFLLAWLTYRFVELPVRMRGGGRCKVAILVVLMATAGYAGYWAYGQKGVPSRPFVTDYQHRLDEINKYIDNIEEVNHGEDFWGTHDSCKDILHFDTQTNHVTCFTTSPQPKILLVGDSHAWALTRALIAKRVALDAMALGHGLCPALEGYTVVDPGAKDDGCFHLTGKIIDALDRFPSIRTVVIASRGPLYFSGKGFGIEEIREYKGVVHLRIVDANGKKANPEYAFYKGYSRLVEKILGLGKKVVFVIDNPELGEDPRYCFRLHPFSLTRKPVSSCTLSLPLGQVMERQKTYRELVAKIKADNLGLTIYDTLPAFCDAHICYGIRDRKLLYWDDDHISVTAAEMLLRDMMTKGLLP